MCILCVFTAGNVSSSREHHHHSGGHEHSHGANEHGHTHEFMSNPGLWTERDKLVNRSDWKQVSLNLHYSRCILYFFHTKFKVIMQVLMNITANEGEGALTL